MQRPSRARSACRLIAAVALGLTCVSSGLAESWFPWRKTEKAATANGSSESPSSARQRPAHQPSNQSTATKPTLKNQQQSAPRNVQEPEQATSKSWWQRSDKTAKRVEQQAKAPTPKQIQNPSPGSVRKPTPPTAESSATVRRPFRPAAAATTDTGTRRESPALITLDEIEPIDDVPQAVFSKPDGVVTPAAPVPEIAELALPKPRQLASPVRVIGFEEGTDVTDTDITETEAPDPTPIPKSGRVLLPFAEPERSPKIQLRPSPTSAELISLTVRDAPLSVVLSLIAEQHGLNLVAGGEVEGRVTVTLNDVALDEALNALLTVNGYSWHRTGSILVVSKVASESLSSPGLRGVVLRVFRLNYIAADDVERVVQSLLSPAGHAVTTIVDSKNNRRTREEIVVEDLPEYVARIEAYIADVDCPPRQVLIEAHVLQVNLKDDCHHGVNLQEMFDIGNTKISLETTGFANPTASPAFFFGIDNANFHMLLEALKVSTDSKTLATPQVLCLNGQHAKIQIGQQLGFLVTTTTQTSTLQNVNFLDVGVVLDVTPTITDEGLVMMQVKPEVSGGQINSSGLPQEDTTEVETTVMLADGQGMIIGGLIKEEDTEVQTKIPYLGDLWLVGRLFQRRSVLRQRNEVIIALVPYIVPYPEERTAAERVGLDRSQSRLLGPQLERLDRRHWEPDLPDAVRNPKHLFSGELLDRLKDPYATSHSTNFIEE